VTRRKVLPRTATPSVVSLIVSILISACSAGSPGPTLTPTSKPPLETTAPEPTSTGEASPTPSATVAPSATASPDPSKPSSCGTRTDFFSVSPMALEDIPYILPLGNFNPPGHVFPTNHLYFQIRRSNPSDANSPTERVALVAPGDLTMTAIRASENLTRGTADYSLTFVVCEEFSGYLNHVTTLVPELVDLYQPPFRWCNGPYTAGSEQFRLCEKEVAIRLGAGDPIGTVGGEPGVFAFDFGAIDGRLPALAFANPQRWSPDERKRACALDYFTNEVKQTLQAKLDRSIEPVCGEIEQDEPATAQGIWFLPGTSVEDDRAGAENQAITLAQV